MNCNKIVLIGMMGSGKTTIGRELEKRKKIPLFEMDEIFEKENCISIRDFFKEFGEKEFRKKESEILKKIVKKEQFIISTGGGIITLKTNRKILFCDDIITIYLKANIDSIFNRIKNDNSRPLLLVDDVKKEISIILNKREKYYRLASCTIETDDKTTDEIVNEIDRLVWKKQ